MKETGKRDAETRRRESKTRKRDAKETRKRDPRRGDLHAGLAAHVRYFGAAQPLAPRRQGVEIHACVRDDTELVRDDTELVRDEIRIFQGVEIHACGPAPVRACLRRACLRRLGGEERVCGRRISEPRVDTSTSRCTLCRWRLGGNAPPT